MSADFQKHYQEAKAARRPCDACGGTGEIEHRYEGADDIPAVWSERCSICFGPGAFRDDAYADAEEYLRAAAMADTHSSDVDPGDFR